MGLIKAGIGAVGGVLADQWREFFYCEGLAADMLVVKGRKRISSQGRSSNTNTEDNIITNGSKIAVNNGQCMIIVEQGRVVDICAEPGEYIYDMSTEPTVFDGGLPNVKAVFQRIGKRFTFGGDTGKDQRVYYFNIKEIVGNKYGTPSAVPYRVVDRNVGLDMDIAIRCYGEYSYKITNPILFYTNVCGNIETEYYRNAIDSQLKSEILTSLQGAFAKISEMGIRYSALPGHAKDIANALNLLLSSKWRDLRGIELVSFGVSSVRASDEDEKIIKDLQRNAAFRDPSMAAANLAGAQADAMRAAAANPGMGAALGFMGMNMAQNMNGVQPGVGAAGGAQPAEKVASADTWACSCGQQGNRGKFCTDCGKARPVPVQSWTCESCGTVNQGNFCSQCGKKRPEEVKKYCCKKCGWIISNPKELPRFCPQCGTPFSSDQTQK